MKMQKPTPEQIDRLEHFLAIAEQEQQAPLHYFQLAQALFEVIPDFRRLLLAYETVADHCCDPDSEMLEFKPDLRRSVLEVLL
jgi:hypothetical protein